MITKLESNFTTNTKIHFEHNISIGGFTYLLIFGSHINGGFICIPNWSIGCEASNLPCSLGYNEEKLMGCGLDKEVAYALASYIDEWLNTHKDH